MRLQRAITATNYVNDKTAATIEPSGSWICCQLGARDHYSVPRGLHRQRSARRANNRSLGSSEPVLLLGYPASSGSGCDSAMTRRLPMQTCCIALRRLSAFEARASLAKSRNIWDPIIARNNWFQSQAVASLEGAQAAPRSSRAKSCSPTAMLLEKSCEQRASSAVPRSWGRSTLARSKRGSSLKSVFVDGDQMANWQRVPESYWEAWREECDLCHRIVVNSAWTRTALIGEGVPAEKIHIVPVAYDPPDTSKSVYADLSEIVLRRAPIARVVPGFPYSAQRYPRNAGSHDPAEDRAGRIPICGRVRGKFMRPMGRKSSEYTGWGPLPGRGSMIFTAMPTSLSFPLTPTALA